MCQRVKMSTESRLVTDMNERELEQVISKTIDSVLNARSHIDSETHRSHHEFVARQKERYESCKASRVKIINGIITAIGIMAVSAMGIWTWDKFKEDLKEPIKVHGR